MNRLSILKYIISLPLRILLFIGTIGCYVVLSVCYAVGLSSIYMIGSVVAICVWLFDTYDRSLKWHFGVVWEIITIMLPNRGHFVNPFVHFKVKRRVI